VKSDRGKKLKKNVSGDHKTYGPMKPEMTHTTSERMTLFAVTDVPLCLTILVIIVQLIH
jgi:hypothetical protein